MLKKRARSNPPLEDRKRLSLWWHYSSRAATKGELRRSNCVKRSNLPKIWPLFCLFCLLTKVKRCDIIGGPRTGRNFYYTILRTFCQGKMLHKFLYKKSQNFVRSHKPHLRIVQSDKILIIFLCNFYIAILRYCDIIYLVSER